MIPAHAPRQRPADAKLLVVGADGTLTHAQRETFVDFLRRGDLVVANDAATLPASLAGTHRPTGAAIEVRLAGRLSEDPTDLRRCVAIVFGSGNFRTPTEDRPLPTRLSTGDRLMIGPLTATVGRVLGHPRLIELVFDGPAAAVWAGLARHGRPIQYAHVPLPLALWDVWTPIAGAPVAFEPPSASYAIDWKMLAAMRHRGIDFATLTLAAGISSTGDPALDRRLPLDEHYAIPSNTARAIQRARIRGGRIVAVGTTVVRALEHAALGTIGVRAGRGVATERIGADSRLRIVDLILSGTHEPGSSHYELLRAFMDDSTLREASATLERQGYRTHEFGDSVLIERGRRVQSGVVTDLARTFRGANPVALRARPALCS